ncbi:MAG: molybdate ABC transporter substrate-binding protein [Proteobacteria bacterium]|nr:molybdate ABC transporter substrate-binding protein [Pseudomonadota bacterium]MBU1737764.1 molybdate ABC transporter substrate-binding protein [Pseudomonadota bacterium]
MKIPAIPIAVVWVILCAFPLAAAERQVVMIATAANFMGAMEKISEVYHAETGSRVETVYSSTGKLYAQIKKGAPYDLFLAADARRPELLAEEGVCAESFVYATGEVVLWTGNRSFADAENWQQVILNEGVRRISVSTPETAPYGAAAFAALEEKGFLPRLRDRLVYGQNVAQAFQFAVHGSTDLGLIALSLALSEKGRPGFFWRVPEAPKIVQKGCVVTGGDNEEAARDFLEFMRGETGRTVLHEFGYR